MWVAIDFRMYYSVNSFPDLIDTCMCTCGMKSFMHLPNLLRYFIGHRNVHKLAEL